MAIPSIALLRGLKYPPPILMRMAPEQTVIRGGIFGYLRKSGSHSIQTNIRHDVVSLEGTNAKDFDELSYLAGYGYEFGEYYKIAFSHATGFRAPDASAFNSDQTLVAETTPPTSCLFKGQR